MSIVWLASYPKSGNTWVRFLLYTYMHGFPAWSRQLRRTIPDIYIDPYDPDAADPLFIKTHEPYSPAHKHIDHTRAAILISRHPADVLRSHWRWYKNISHNTHPDPAVYADAFIENGGDP